MRHASWFGLLGIGAALAGCGGGGAAAAGSGTGGGAPGPSTGAFSPVAAAKIDYDAETGRATVTQLKSDPGGRAIWTGETVAISAADLTTSDGQTTIRSSALKIRNNTGAPIGQNGLRLQFREIPTIPSPDFRLSTRVTTVAGTGVNSSVDGPGATATTSPQALSPLPDGGVAVLDTTSLRTFKNGLMNTVVGGFGSGGGLVVVKNGSGTFAFVSDQANHRIRWVDFQTGVEGNLVGTGAAGDVVGAPGTAQFSSPRGLAWFADSLIVADAGNGKVKRVQVSFGGGVPNPTSVANVFSALSTPSAVASNGAWLAIAEEGAQRVRLCTSLAAGAPIVQLGSGVGGYLPGSGATARFSQPTSLAWAGRTLYVMNGNLGSVSAVFPMADANPWDPDSYQVGLIAGTGLAGFAEGTGSAARFSTQATGLAAFGGRIYVADRNNRRLRAIDTVGVQFDGGFADFAATVASPVRISNATGLIGGTSDDAPVPYIAVENSVGPNDELSIGRVDFEMDRGVKRFAFYVLVEAGGGPSLPSDGVDNGLTPGPGSPNAWVERLVSGNIVVDGGLGSASSAGVLDVDVDGQGNVYFCENNAIRRIDIKAQTVSTIAGGPSFPVGTADGDPSTVGRVQLISGLAVTASGDTIMFTQGTHTVRVLQYMGSGSRNDRSSYILATVLGATATPGNVMGIGGAARFNNPTSISITDDGKRGVLCDDTANRFIRLEYTGSTTSEPARLVPASYVVVTNNSGVIANVVETEIDNRGTIYFVASSGGLREVRRVSYPGGVNEFFVPSGPTDADGSPPKAVQPSAMGCDDAGNLWFASIGDANDNELRIRRANLQAYTVTVAGGGMVAQPLSGPGNTYQFGGTASRGAAGKDGTYYFAAGSALYRISRIVR